MREAMNVRRLRTAGIVLGLLLVTLIAPGMHVAAANSPVRVVVVSPSSGAYVGQAITATVHVFSSGYSVDASTLYVNLSGSSGSRSLTPTRTGAGVYDVSFTVASTDVNPYSECGSSAICIDANATVGSNYDREFLGLPITSYAVTITPSVNQAAAGQTVGVTAVVTENGTPLDPSTFTLSSYLVVPSGADVQQTLVTSHTTTGTYTASVVIPTPFTGDGILYLDGFGTVGGISVSGQISVGVGQPTGLWVWARLVAAGVSSGAVDIYATNATGWPVAGAPIAGSYAYQTASQVTTPFTATTDANGTARIDMSYPGAQYGARYYGTVTIGGVAVGFRGYIDPPDPGLLIVQDPATSFFTPGSAASTSATFYANTVLLASQTLYYVVYTEHAIVASGMTATDAAGKAGVSFLMPSAPAWVAFTADVGGAWFSNVMGVSQKPLVATHNTVHAGDALQISIASLPAGVRDISFTLQAVSAGLTFDPSWTLASGASGSVDVAYPTGSSFQASIRLPRLLPKGQDYYVSLWGEPTVWGADYFHYADTFRIDNLPPVASAVASSSNPAPGTAVTVNASASSDPDGLLVAYRFAWGDGATSDWSANATGTHTYASAGDYTVTVSVRDDNGAVSSTTVTLHVQAPGGGGDFVLPVAIAVVVVAAAGVAFFLWRRSRRPPTVAPAPTEGATSGGPPLEPPPAPPGSPPT